MIRRVAPLILLLVVIPPLHAQSSQPAPFTVGVRGGLGQTNRALGRDSLFQGNVTVMWQAEIGFRVASRLAAGLEGARIHTPEFAGDCPSNCSPAPEFTAISAALTWAPGRSGSRTAVLLGIGTGLYRLRGSQVLSNSWEVGLRGGVELPVIRVGRTNWLSAGLRADLIPGAPGSAISVITVSVGIRHWGI